MDRRQSVTVHVYMKTAIGMRETIMDFDLHEEEIDPDQKVERFLGKITSEKRLIVLLEKAALESVKLGNSFQLLNSDKHRTILKKHHRDPNNARPDIVHQCLMMLLDSPLNQAGFLQIFIHTQQNILIEVNPQIRIPRTFERFCGLMG
ncbi:Ribosomal RNA small subunit methyltransferase NEP1 [Thelohanellus kitauei]|uniref:Ribosomal RNA small subunit methyltransferase NEP1 n=1 Tax=Thelohanellus kitauei TaxID=669202 RepID=A0A0C2N5R2_THEKT|nr:Ribosomal RNA small subunit methyltransferase NEP1 [Thelohanellus kitauei]